MNETKTSPFFIYLSDTIDFMEKILQILSVFVLLVLVIKIFAKKPDKDFKEYYLFKRIVINEGFLPVHFALNTDNRHLFILSQTKVFLIDMDTDEMKEQFSLAPGTKSMAVAHKWNRGFFSNAEAASLIVIDLKSLIILETRPVSGFEDGILFFEPFSDQLFIFNRYKNCVLIIDPDKSTIKRSILLPGKLSCPVADETGNLYGIIKDENLIIEIDAFSGRVGRQWFIECGQGTGCVAIDKRNELLFTGCSNKKLGVFECKTARLLCVVELGEVPDNVVFEPETGLIFVSNVSGTITILSRVKRDEYKIVQHLQTEKGSGDMAVDSITKKIYLATPIPDPNTGDLASAACRLLVFSNE